MGQGICNVLPALDVGSGKPHAMLHLEEMDILEYYVCFTTLRAAFA